MASFGWPTTSPSRFPSSLSSILIFPLFLLPLRPPRPPRLIPSAFNHGQHRPCRSHRLSDSRVAAGYFSDGLHRSARLWDGAAAAPHLCQRLWAGRARVADRGPDGLVFADAIPVRAAVGTTVGPHWPPAGAHRGVAWLGRVLRDVWN